MIPQTRLVGPVRETRLIKCRPASAKLPPTIRLAGQWLTKAGFVEGQSVTVEITGNGEMLIRQIHDLPPSKIEAERLELLKRFEQLEPKIC